MNADLVPESASFMVGLSSTTNDFWQVNFWLVKSFYTSI